MLMHLPLYFVGSKGEKTLYTLFDSQITYSLISATCVENLGLVTTLRTPMNVSANGDLHSEINKVCCLDFYHKEIRLSDEFLVLPLLSEEVVIGAATLRKWGLNLDFENGDLIINARIANPILINLRGWL